MSVELKSAVDIKYINIKMKKKPKNNSEIIDYIKDADELCVKIMLFLLCSENLDKIEFDFMKNSVRYENTAALSDDDFIEAMDFWKMRDILDYEITSAPNVKGAHMGNIINIILNISRDINIVNEEETAEDTGEFNPGLGIFDGHIILSKKAPPKAPLPENPVEFIKAPAEREKPAVKKSKSEVSIDELSESLEANDSFGKLIHEMQIKMKTIFNINDLTIIYNLYNNERMDAELITKLVEIQVEDNKNNISYIESVALGFVKDGILTLGQYEEKTRQIREIIEFENKITVLFKIEDKKLKQKEKNHIKSWMEFDFPEDMLLEGYNRCWQQIEKLSLDYINTIYINWHQKGFRTLSDAQNEFAPLPEGAANSGKRKSEVDIDQFLEKSIKKTLKF